MGFDRSTHALSFHIGHIGFQINVHRISLVLQESYAVFVVRTAAVFPSWLQRTLAAMLRAFIATKATAMVNLKALVPVTSSGRVRRQFIETVTMKLTSMIWNWIPIRTPTLTPLSLLTTSVGVTTKNQGLRVRSLRVRPGVGLLSPDDRPSHRGVVTWLLGEPSWSTVPTSSPNRSHGPWTGEWAVSTWTVHPLLHWLSAQSET